MKKGFTLIELLAVITLLALLATLAIPGVMRISKDMKKNMYCKKIDGIITDVERYAQDHISEIKTCDNGSNEYSIATLINKGITKSEEKNSTTLNDPYTGGNLDGKFLVCKKNNRAYASYSSNDTELNNLCD